jgi:hypothetical protein
MQVRTVLISWPKVPTTSTVPKPGTTVIVEALRRRLVCVCRCGREAALRILTWWLLVKSEIITKIRRGGVTRTLNSKQLTAHCSMDTTTHNLHNLELLKWPSKTNFGKVRKTTSPTLPVGLNYTEWLTKRPLHELRKRPRNNISLTISISSTSRALLCASHELQTLYVAFRLVPTGPT